MDGMEALYEVLDSIRIELVELNKLLRDNLQLSESLDGVESTLINSLEEVTDELKEIGSGATSGLGNRQGFRETKRDGFGQLSAF